MNYQFIILKNQQLKVVLISWLILKELSYSSTIDFVFYVFQIVMSKYNNLQTICDISPIYYQQRHILQKVINYNNSLRIWQIWWYLYRYILYFSLSRKPLHFWKFPKQFQLKDQTNWVLWHLSRSSKQKRWNVPKFRRIPKISNF